MSTSCSKTLPSMVTEPNWVRSILGCIVHLLPCLTRGRRAPAHRPCGAASAPAWSSLAATLPRTTVLPAGRWRSWRPEDLALEGVGRAQDGGLVAVPSDQHHADRQPGGHRAGHVHGR